MDFIVEKALVLVPVLWVIGYYLKKTPRVYDWVIPWVLTAVGIAGAIGLMGVTVDAILQGVLVSGAAVLGHQLIKQAKKGD